MKRDRFSTRALATLATLAIVLGGLVSAADAQRRPPYVEMNYGPTLAMTLELSPDNVAHKGIAVRLDDGPGGVSRGTSFAVFDTDTLRYAGAWHGEGFIDWHGIIFDGAHGAHPKIAGELIARHGMAPGWVGPGGRTDDPRLRGVDGRAYGPLPGDWGRWNGMYLVGRRAVMSYAVLGTQILDSPGVAGDPARPRLVRTLEIAPHDQPLVVSVADWPNAVAFTVDRQSLEPATDASAASTVAVLPVVAAPASGQLDLASDFTIAAWIKTSEPTGTILSKAAVDGPWVPRGKTFFVRHGRLGFDVGWVGVVQSDSRIDDGQWHHVAVTYRAAGGQTRLFIDGKADGSKRLASPDGDGHVVRLGYTATDFMPPLVGVLDDVRFYGRTLNAPELVRAARGLPAEGPVAHWPLDEGEGTACANAESPSFAGTISGAAWTEGKSATALRFDGKAHVLVSGRRVPDEPSAPDWRRGRICAVALAGELPGARWQVVDDHIRLVVPPSAVVRTFRIVMGSLEGAGLGAWLEPIDALPEPDRLESLTHGGPRRWLAKIPTELARGADDGPFSVDTITLPDANPWDSWMRLGGFDYFSDPSRGAVCTWQGDVWLVEGLGANMRELVWQRIATGLFQPLGLKIVDDTIYVLGRDQITRLHDLNGDGETDYYENFNNDAQVTEHFHEFAMDLQVDAAGNFYYTKGARHALPAVVPHHGTLIRVSADGTQSDIIAKGFRAPNGLHVNDDGTFYSSDQEGHWTPMNRINLIRPGGFYGNMMAYVPERTDTSHDPPLCWIHKAVDRSPSEPLRVRGSAWNELEGGLLSLSYGTGRIWVVLDERVGPIVQGGITRLPIAELPTGIHRARFHPADGQLYVAGLFGWSSNQTRPGGFFRIRRTAEPLHLATELRATSAGVMVGLTTPLADSAADPGRYRVERWNYRRSADYGSDDYRPSDGRPGRDSVPVTDVVLSRDRRSIFLALPAMAPVMQMQIEFNLVAADGTPMAHQIHHTVNALGDPAAVADRFDRPIGRLADARPVVEERSRPGLLLRLSAGRNEATPEDMRVSRLLALQVGEDETVSPFLPAGAFTAVWEGQLVVDLTDRYEFSAEVAGGFTLSLDGRQVLVSDPSARGVQQITGEPVELSAGGHVIRAHYTAPAGSERVVRVSWKSQRFHRELLPPWLLRHDPQRSGLPDFQRRRDGRELFATLNCQRCHLDDTERATHGMPELVRDAPRLDGIAGRLSPEWIAAWIQDPRRFRRHATMPRMLEPSENAGDVAAHIARFLAQRPGDPPGRPPAVDGVAHRDGERLYEELGCMACHTFSSPEDDDPFGRTSLHFAAAKYLPGALIEFLERPHDRYQWSAMPDFRLTAAEAAALAAFVRAESHGRLTAGDSLGQADALLGRRAFVEHGCIHCHPVEGIRAEGPTMAGNRVFGNLTPEGCLADKSAGRVAGQPQYQLADPQRQALRAFLVSGSESLRRESRIEVAERVMTSLRCGACHDRDQVRSPRREIIAEEGSGRVPELLPSLSWTGEKLKHAWLHALLEGGAPARSRPWLSARMPIFAIHSEHLADGITAQHGRGRAAGEPPTFDPALAEVGRRLAAVEGGFNCVQCHGVGDHPATAPFDNRGVNFARVASRLERDYYFKWMLDPLRLEPQSKMPQFAANGTTTSIADVYDGNAHRQFEALWHFLLSVADPESDGTANTRRRNP